MTPGIVLLFCIAVGYWISIELDYIALQLALVRKVMYLIERLEDLTDRMEL